MKILPLIAIGGIALSCGAHASTVIMSDDFTQNPGNFRGRDVQTPQAGTEPYNWGGAGGSSSNQTVAGNQANITASGTFAKVYTGFNGSEAGNQYSMSFDLIVDGAQLFSSAANPTQNPTFYFGFGVGNSRNDNPNENTALADDYGNFGFGGGSKTDNILAYGFKFQGDFYDGESATASYFSGNSSGNGYTGTDATFNRTGVDGGGLSQWDTNFRIDVDVLGDNVNFFIDDTLVGSTDYDEELRVAGIWGKISNTTNGINDTFSFTNFQVTTAAVPEPSSTALLGLSGLAFLLRRRR